MVYKELLKQISSLSDLPINLLSFSFQIIPRKKLTFWYINQIY